MISESLSFVPVGLAEPEKPGWSAVGRTTRSTPAVPSTTAGVVKDKALTATDSPCVAICSTLFDDICRGCGRTAMEVSNWVFMTEDEKKLVWTRILAQGYPRR